ncbi:Permease of the major facilitator superfamily [Paramicrosporidium saccamoebae]|uniref:Permease of the major facilitator superfamily n=1 Tax=Paramicrosporidium saccamoebae TaxID=1246581 RepID=A0A2H9TH17_9FUNG|nr:Permease of the major facilitator superfamily [Paramicrosporidium saccamoebae]
MTAYAATKGLVETKEESFVERWLIMPKIIYFMVNMFVYSFHGIMPHLFLKVWGFSQHLYSYATMIMATNFFGSMIWTSLADRTGRYKAIIIVTSAIYTALSIVMIMYDAPKEPTTFDYVKVFVGFGIWNIFLSASFPLVDAQVISKLSKNPKLSKDQLGNQRTFGAVGRFIATLASFLVLGSKTGLIAFIVISFTGLALSVAFGIEDSKIVKKKPHHGDIKEKEGVVVEARNPVVTLMTNPSFLFFMLFVAGMGTVRSVTSSFQKVIMADLSTIDPKNPSWLARLGFSSGFEKNFKTAIVDFGRMVSEIFVYLIAKDLKNLFGVYWILVLSQLFGILRLFGYGLLNKDSSSAYYLTWGLELIKGFGSGLINSSAIPIASSIAPPGCENTAQGLYSGNYAGLSNAISGAFSGAILHYKFIMNGGMTNQDVQSMFCWVSLATFLVTVGMACKFIFVDRVMGIPGFPRRASFAN